MTAAVAKAVDVAKKNMHTLKLYKGTFPHEAQAKVGGSNILLKPASQGTGLIAGGVVRTVLEVAGVSNALSKSLGSTNKINTAYATLEALKSMESAQSWVTRKDGPATKPSDVKTTNEPKTKTIKAPAKKPAEAKKTAVKAKATAKGAK